MEQEERKKMCISPQWADIQAHATARIYSSVRTEEANTTAAGTELSFSSLPKHASGH